jgi:hypothetical protein
MSFHPADNFKYIADRLDRFAEKHNLKVEKYYQNMPFWNFFFNHPLGGYGRIDIACEDHNVYLIKWWTIDDYDKRKRYHRHESVGKIENEDQLEAKMLEAIREILGWEKKSLKNLGRINPGLYSEPANRPKYPIPTGL